MHACWRCTPCLTYCSSEKDLSNAWTQISITFAICFFAQEITLTEAIKCWEGNTCSHRKMKNIIAEELFPFYQWNHPISNSLFEALVKSNIITCSVHIYWGEQKHGDFTFQTPLKNVIGPAASYTDGGLHISTLAGLVLNIICPSDMYSLSVAIRFQYKVWDHSQVIDTEQENNILESVS